MTLSNWRKCAIASSGLVTESPYEPLGHERDVTYVASDDRDGARQMTEYLRSTGRRRIAIITGPLDTPGGVDRLAGYREIVGHGDPELIATGDYTRASGETAMARLLEQAPDLDAVFVCSDLMAERRLADNYACYESSQRQRNAEQLRRTQRNPEGNHQDCQDE